MSGYDVIVFFHVLAVIVWIGGGVAFQTLLLLARRAGPESVAGFNQLAEKTSNVIFMPASFATLGFGIWLVVASEAWSFGDSWIVAGLVGYAISALIGMTVFGPTAKKLKGVIEQRGPNDPVAAHLARRMNFVGWFDLLIVIAVVFNMVVKPGV